MKKQLLLSFLTVMLSLSFCHAQFVNTPRPSPKAAVAEWIGLSKIAIHYSRPGVKDRTVFGENGIVTYNEGIPFPWRAGANENTTMYFEHDVKINGQDLAAGKYGFHIIPAEKEWTLIFSTNHHAWGSYNYDQSEDALRVKVQPKEGKHVEWLRYQFVNQQANSADIELAWSTKRIQFTVAVDNHAVTARSIEQEIDGLLGFTWQGSNSAAQYFLGAGKDFEKGLKYAQRATNPQLGGQRNFSTLSTQSQLLSAMGKADEAKTIMDEAIGLGTMTELHFYGRSLIQAGQAKDAMAIFELNRKNNPHDNFTTYVGLARGNMALENYGKAASYFRKAAPNAPRANPT